MRGIRFPIPKPKWQGQSEDGFCPGTMLSPSAELFGVCWCPARSDDRWYSAMGPSTFFSASVGKI